MKIKRILLRSGSILTLSFLILCAHFLKGVLSEKDGIDNTEIMKSVSSECLVLNDSYVLYGDDLFWVDDIEEYESGDYIIVENNGSVKEIYPGSFEKVYSIRLVEGKKATPEEMEILLEKYENVWDSI